MFYMGVRVKRNCFRNLLLPSAELQQITINKGIVKTVNNYYYIIK